MSVKLFNLDGIGQIKVYKRRGARSLRLSLGSDGGLKLVMPVWSSYRAGLNFVLSQKQWISEQVKPLTPLTSGMSIGKQHILYLKPAHRTTVRTKLADGQAIVLHPVEMDNQHVLVQQAAKRVSLKALTRDSEDLILPRLKQLADEFGFSYQSACVKHLKARWGSCSSKGDISLSLFLAQLPWPLIDYVLIHELVHTKVFGHGPKFWEAMNSHLPDVKSLRKQIKLHKPIIVDSSLSV